MANTKLNKSKQGTPRGNGRRRNGAVYFENGASAWKGKGQIEENRRVMLKLPGIPLMAVPQGTAAETAILELLDS